MKSRFAIVFACSLFAFIAPAKNGAPRVQYDKQPLPRDANGVASFANVIRKVGPAVLTVSATKTVRDSGTRSPLDDPMLRRFFEDEEGTSSSRRGGRDRERLEQGVGSGVIISPDGYILSNNHVVEGADEIKVRFSTGGPEYQARLVGTDPPTDIAVLKINVTNSLTPITLTDSSTLQVGDVVLAVGNPFGVGQTVTMGIVSATGRGGFGIVDYEDFIQTDASINPGNSGGALVDALGRLVGIPTAIVSRSGGSMGIGFAVPVDLARYVMERIITEGRVIRGYLGVYVQEVTPELAKAFNVAEGTGALVGGVVTNSPAMRAGVREGDVILEMNDKKVDDSRGLRLAIAQAAPNSTATFKVLREGQTRSYRINLGQLQIDDEPTPVPERSRTPPARRNDNIPGIEISDLDNRTRTQLGIPQDVRGAMIMNVERDSLAAENGLRPGDVIMEVNKQKIRTAREFTDLTRKATGSILLRIWSRMGNRYVVIESPRRQR
ncbi:MAG TPA: Do family serine endopeptidase [Verrucomicrobiae bacterium]|nr:Do family serine endopeptidase [Verrucomicrobiae bacterium]